METSKIREFYKDASIFITGATGFVGKTLMEKLLRTTEVEAIYMLIREKKGKTLEERMDKMFDNPLFDVLKSQKPDYRSKIRPVVGECGTEGLIISDTDKEELKANVNVLFHSAATVNFDEDLKTAYEINVKGTKTILDMAKEMSKLKALVYVSTAYSNCPRDAIIEEKVYDYEFVDAVAKIEKSTKEDIVLETPKIIGMWPNTYTFTKAVAEILVKNEGLNLPIGIFRPSIIVSTYKEPIPGWVDNIYALNGISVGIMTGFLRILLSNADTVIDAIPVDKCASAMIASAWDIAESRKLEKGKDIPVYNFTSGNENPLSNGLLSQLNFANGVSSLKALWVPCSFFVSNQILFWLLTITLEIIPAFFMDALALLTGNRPRLVSLYAKVLNFMTKVKFFGMKTWKFDNENVQALWKKLDKTDQELFPFSMASFSWFLFTKTYTLGLRRYILKEDDASLPQSWKRYNRLTVAHYVLKAVTLYIVYYVIHMIFSKLYKIIVA